ncbi:MAG: hypothetical protein NTZ64_15020 [Polaromonas sp.]|nr:hypothetical protein [Polaromonas sp.]
MRVSSGGSNGWQKSSRRQNSSVALFLTVHLHRDRFAAIFHRTPVAIPWWRIAAYPKLRLSYQEHRWLEIKAELLNIGKAGQKKYAELALEYLQKAGVATTTTSRKIESGNWMTGVLFSKMIEGYAIEQYGLNWGGAGDGEGKL